MASPRVNDPRQRETERDQGCNVIHNLILELARHSFCHILLVTHTNPGTVVRRDAPETRIPGGGDHWGVIVTAGLMKTK